MAYIIGAANDDEIKALRAAGFDNIFTLTPAQRGYVSNIYGGDITPEANPSEEDDDPLIAIYVDCDLAELVSTANIMSTKNTEALSDSDSPDIDPVVAAAVIALGSQIAIRGAEDADWPSINYYIRLDASEVVEFDMTDSDALEEISEAGKAALTAMFAASAAGQLKSWDRLLSYDGSFNAGHLSSWNSIKAGYALDAYIARQRSLYPDLTIVDNGIS